MWLSMMLTAAEASMLVFFCVVPVWAEDDSSVLSERSPVSGSVPETAAVTASCCAPALTVIVQNLPYVADDQDMYDIFDGLNVVEAQVFKLKDGRSSGFAFVTFASHDEQMSAINDVDSTVVEGRTIHISPALLFHSQLEHEKSVVEAAAKNNE